MWAATYAYDNSVDQALLSRRLQKGLRTDDSSMRGRHLRDFPQRLSGADAGSPTSRASSPELPSSRPMTEITSRLSTALADRYKIERHLDESGMATVDQPLISFLSIASVRRET